MQHINKKRTFELFMFVQIVLIVIIVVTIIFIHLNIFSLDAPKRSSPTVTNTVNPRRPQPDIRPQKRQNESEHENVCLCNLHILSELNFE